MMQEEVKRHKRRGRKKQNGDQQIDNTERENRETERLYHRYNQTVERTAKLNLYDYTRQL